MEQKIKRKTLKLSELAAASNTDRNVTIDSRIRDVIQDYRILAKEKNSDETGKCKMNEALPPNTFNFRQYKLIRDLTELGENLKEEIEQCDTDDVIRQQLLEEVTKKTNDLARKFLEVEAAYNGVLTEKENHNEVMEVFSKEVEYYAKTSKRYALCGEALSEVGKIMQKAINENKCFEDFIRSLYGKNMSSGAASYGLAAFIAEFETIESAKKTTSDQMDQVLAKGEKAQLAVLQTKNKFVRELKYTIEGLITSHQSMQHAGVMNERYEKALNAMSVDTVNALTTLTKVLNSAENMVEKLILTKAIDHSYRKKTLAKQLEAIRKDYIKKKAIIHEYHKSKARKDRNRAVISEAVDKEEELQEQMAHQKLRLVDLAKKRIKMAWIDQRDQEAKRSKRDFLRYYSPSPTGFVEQDKKYNPLEDWTLKEEESEVGRGAEKRIATDPDDYDKSSSEDDEADMAVYCGPTHGDLLVLESEKQISFMMAAESDVSASHNEKQVEGKRKSTVSVDSSDSSDVDFSRDKRMSSFSMDILKVPD